LVETRMVPGILDSMKDKNTERSDLRDRNKATEERPVPSQAEGDLETVEEDLDQKEKSEKQGGTASGNR